MLAHGLTSVQTKYKFNVNVAGQINGQFVSLVSTDLNYI